MHLNFSLPFSRSALHMKCRKMLIELKLYYGIIFACKYFSGFSYSRDCHFEGMSLHCIDNLGYEALCNGIPKRNAGVIMSIVIIKLCS